MSDFLGTEGAGEDGALAVREPLLEHLVASELVVPDGGGDIAPEGGDIEVDVEGRLAEGGKGVAKGFAFLRRVGAFDSGLK